MIATIRQTPYLIFHQQNRGVLACYQQDRDVINAQIDALR